MVWHNYTIARINTIYITKIIFFALYKWNILKKKVKTYINVKCRIIVNAYWNIFSLKVECCYDIFIRNLFVHSA